MQKEILRIENQVEAYEQELENVKLKIKVLKELQITYPEYAGFEGLCDALHNTTAVTKENFVQITTWFRELLYTSTSKMPTLYIWDVADVVSRNAWIREQIDIYQELVFILKRKFALNKDRLAMLRRDTNVIED